MKRAILIATAVLAAYVAALAHAAEPPLTVLLAGGSEANMIEIALSPDGRSYVIDSVVPLDVGGNVCWHPEGHENELVCEAASIGGFEVNAGAGDDSVTVAREVAVPVTLRGGPGQDRLVGGAAPGPTRCSAARATTASSAAAATTCCTATAATTRC